MYKSVLTAVSYKAKTFLEFYLLWKPRGDSNSQPRGKYHGSMQLSYWATHKLTNQKFLKNERKLGREDGFAPSTSKGLPLVLCY